MASSSKEQELAIKIAGKVENSFKQSLGVTEDGLNKIASVAKKAAAVAAAAFAAVKVGDFISGAVDEYAEFEQAMANTSAIAGASADDYAKLSAAAREAGKATTFTASEAADALGYMALAGWNVEESTAALTPVLKLAEATQADLATTSDQVTDSMSAMGVGIDDLQGYLDVIVTTNNKANTTAADLMDAFIGCGGAARAAGMNYKETSTALGILANNGIKGSEAGTALNSMLVRISTKDVAQKAFKDLGVAVYDSSGEMRNMRDILVDLNGAMAGMTQEQKNSYMSAIAGTNYYSQFGYLLDGVKEGVNGSASAWDELAGAIDNSTGALDAMDATATGTLQGGTIPVGNQRPKNKHGRGLRTVCDADHRCGGIENPGYYGRVQRTHSETTNPRIHERSRSDGRRCSGFCRKDSGRSEFLRSILVNTVGRFRCRTARKRTDIPWSDPKPVG